MPSPSTTTRTIISGGLQRQPHLRSLPLPSCGPDDLHHPQFQASLFGTRSIYFRQSGGIASSSLAKWLNVSRSSYRRLMVKTSSYSLPAGSVEALCVIYYYALEKLKESV